MKPLAIDLFCGLGGWTTEFLAEGWDVIGFDIERRPYPAQLVLQDVLTLHGSQFRHSSAIVASPPCQEFSYMAMPWKRGKQIARALRSRHGERDFPDGYTGSRSIVELTDLFWACFRIQREASEATGQYIPMVVENVKGAQPWVGRARANFGSFYLWGDVDSIGGRIVRRGDTRWGMASVKAATRGQKVNPDGTDHGQGSWFAVADSKNRGAGQKGRSNFHFFEQTGLPSPSFHGHEDEPSVQRYLATKNSGGSWFNQAHNTESGVGNNPDGRKWKGPATGDIWKDRESRRLAQSGGNSPKRQQASAEIAMIPPALARYIAQVFTP